MTPLWAAALAAILIRPAAADMMMNHRPAVTKFTSEAEQDQDSGAYASPAEVNAMVEQAKQELRPIKGLDEALEKAKTLQIPREGLEVFIKRFVPARVKAQNIWDEFVKAHPEDKPPNIPDDATDRDLEAAIKTIMGAMHRDDPRAAAKMEAARGRLESAHKEFMDTGGALSNLYMKSDPGMRFLMIDKAGHDDDYLRSHPDDPDAWQYVARQKLLNGDKAGGLAAAQRAVELGPGDAKSLALLSSAYFDAKKYNAALSAARAALSLDPNNATANAVVKLARDPSSASVATPASAPADGDLGGVPVMPLSEAMTTTMSPAQQQSLQLARDAEKALSLGDMQAAERAAARAVELSPDYAHGFGLLGFAQAKQSKLEEALQASARGLKLNGADRMSHDARLLALNKAGRYQEALVAGSAALEADGDSAFARYMNAVARNGLGDRTGALEELRQAGAVDARYRELYDAAKQLSQDGDMSLLFTDVGPRLAPAKPAGGGLGRTYALIGGAAAGGLLLGFGLLGLARRKREGGGTMADLAPAPMDRLLGGQFQITRRVGQGGMGTVFEGTDVKLQRRVAIKRMRDELRFDESLRRRFVTEAKLVASLSHPNIVALYSIVDEGEELSLIFEYVQGRTLHDVIASKGRLSFAQALSTLRGVSDALAAAHARGIIHRDLKPANIMITAEGSPKVMDFGVARAAQDAVGRQSTGGTIVGTPAYMAPEQEQGAVRVESDVYALAVCLYEALSGALPWGGTSGGMLMAKINKAYTPISRLIGGLPPGLDAVFDRAFEPDPERRYHSVAELRAALEALPVAV